MRKVGILISDTHAGHRLGLMDPSTELPETEVKLNEAQAYLWQLYNNSLEYAKRFVGRDECFIIHDGDITQGTKRPKELVSARMADHVLIAQKIAEHTIEYFGNNLKAMKIARGTGSHVFEEGSSEILLADMLGKQYPHLGIKSVYHGELEVAGVKIDYAHHGPGPGSRSWLMGNELRYYLRDRMMQSMLSGTQPANVYIRGHFHTYRHEMLEVGSTTGHAVLLPSMCLLDDFSRQVARSPQYVVNGIVLVEIVDNRINIIPLTNTLDFRVKDKI